ncbi:YecA family protein [Azomonas macrocytogenes]|uniref:Uncharacterized protein n=1 Tax=Azomonas macrocytogenes TaxID=69962 RepID=A0A839T0H0_AZOMA|nr:YecA family protein [Azomonas macrocytogenes]MBB3102628.1 hypothetical protein [Azomonas macrocytogenes]
MSIQNSPYTAFAGLLTNSGSSVSPAELHGLLLGRSCAGAGFTVDPWLEDAAELLGVVPEDRLRQALVGLQEMAKGELASSDIALILLLPSDEMPLAERAAALGQWCQGFLAGFGLAAGSRTLSQDATETLQDLAAIAQVENRLDESENGENDYMEVMEYLRVAPLLLFTECAAPVEADMAEPEPKPPLH